MSKFIEYITGIVLIVLAGVILWWGGKEPVTYLLFPKPVPVSIRDITSGNAPVSRMVRVRGRFMPGIGFVRERTAKDSSGREEPAERSYFILFSDAAGNHLYVSSEYTQGILAVRYPGEREITAVARPFTMSDTVRIMSLSQREQVSFNEGSYYLELIDDRRGYLINAGIKLSIVLAVTVFVGAIGVLRVKNRKPSL